MLLSDISPNIRRSAATATSAQAKSRDGVSQNARDSLPPSAIRSMLKTSTETGDIGQFSVRPSRLPRSGSRIQTTRQRSGSFDTSFASALRHRRTPPLRHHSGRRYAPFPAQSLSGLSRKDTIHSNLTSYTQNPRSRTRTYRQFAHGLEGLASPPPGSQGLYSHRSLMTLRSQRDFNSMHSSSPRMYPTRPRPTGHRAPSPAFSDTPYARQLRSGKQHAGAGGTASSSPASMLRARHGYPGYHRDFEGSFSSLIRLPSPAIPHLGYGAARFYRPRTTTPHSASFRGGPRAGSSCSISSFPRLPRSPTGSTTPQYYDYTESFVEEDRFYQETDHTQSSLLFNIDQTILENGPAPAFRHAQTPFGTMPGSSFHPSELPTKHNRRPSEHSVRIPPIEIPCRTSSLGASILSAEQKAKLKKIPNDFKGSLEKSLEDCDQRRSSITSHRTCTSSHSSSFFQNTSRSPRDLTSLAARVHSPTSDNALPNQSVPAAFLKKTSCRSPLQDHSRSVFGSSLPTWQLPSLNFRPLSIVSHVNNQTARRRTSTSSIRQDQQIISPTPERPMSSQSRKRFSRILEIDDDYSPSDGKTRPLPRTYNSLNFSKLNRLEELPESAYPARLSIPPFSPRNTMMQEPCAGHEIDIINTYADARSSQNMSNERSTIESLLERHIECLGLQPDHDASSRDSDCDCIGEKTADAEDVTLKLPKKMGSASNAWRKCPGTSRSWNHSSLETVDRLKLVPRRLFSHEDTSRVKLPTSESLPCMSETTSTDFTFARDRPSMGWQTLASTSQFASGFRKPSLLSGELADLSSEANSGRLKFKRCSGLNVSPYSSSVWTTEDTSDLSECSNIGPVHQRLREDFNRTASHRRKMRIRLKLKRNSLSLGRLDQSLCPPDQTSGLLSDNSETPEPVTTTIETSAGALAELSAEPSKAIPVPVISEPMANQNANQQPSASPQIPNRWSSIVAGFPQPIKRSIDVVRKASVRTTHSHRSNKSLAEPLNSSRLSSQIPRLGSVPRLTPPEFGPPLTTSDLNLSLPYAEVPSTIRPTLRETRSFFSDDSSGIQTGRSSHRKRFHLHGFRGGLAVSPKNTLPSTNERLRNTAQGKVHHSYRVVGQKSSEQDVLVDGTIGMSEFAYRKRKILERLKSWWRRQCMQKTLALKRGKSTRSFPW